MIYYIRNSYCLPSISTWEREREKSELNVTKRLKMYENSFKGTIKGRDQLLILKRFGIFKDRL